MQQQAYQELNNKFTNKPREIGVIIFPKIIDKSRKMLYNKHIIYKIGIIN